MWTERPHVEIPRSRREFLAKSGAGFGALALSSAITGYGRTADCRRAREALPEGPTPTSRYVLDVQALADVRARGNQ